MQPATNMLCVTDRMQNRAVGVGKYMVEILLGGRTRLEGKAWWIFWEILSNHVDMLLYDGRK